jgi:nitrite reductase/ring-hydroxylating ferredoxin subunit
VSLMGYARRLRSGTELQPETNAMETVVCSKCGQRFAIHNGAPLHDQELGEKQTSWVADQLVWDHIQQRKHHGRIELPAFE